MIHESYRCMNCGYTPWTGKPFGPKATTPTCNCPSPAIALDNCPLAIAYKKHLLNVHNIQWG